MIDVGANWILINSSQRRIYSYTSVSMYCQPLKVTPSVKFLRVTIDNHLNMKLHVGHLGRTYLVSRMNIIRPNSTIATLLILLYRIFARSCMDYASTVLTILNKTQSHWLEVIQNRCFHYAQRTVDCTCISNDECCSRCNIVSVVQCILAAASNWWQKASDNNDSIVHFI